MGITKTEGVLKSGCIETLKVLIDEKNIIFTLLDVLRHDPLYQWSISPLVLKKLFRNENTEDAPFKSTSTDADIALFGVKKKLTRLLSVECQVQELINTAQDEGNLCRMYPGWQPWL